MSPIRKRSSDTPTSSPKLAALATVVILGSIMSVLDVTVVNVAMHPLAEHFDASLATIQWVASGYSLALASVIPVTAWAIRRFGTKRVYMTALLLFVSGSLAAGLAWSTESLVAFRVLQGLGGGMIMPTGMTIMMRAGTPETMGRIMSILGIPILIGPLAGPVLGGWLVDSFSWRWMFTINVPIGLLAFVLAARVFPRSAGASGQRLDVPGLLMLSPGLAGSIYGLSTGAERRDFSSLDVLLPAVLGVALMVGFVLRARTSAHPLIDLRLYRRRAFAAGAATMALFVVGYFGSMLLLPMYFQVVRGESVTASGLLGAPLALAAGITMQFSGRLSDRVSPRKLITSGIVLAAFGMALFAGQLTDTTPYWRIGLALFVMGVGVGMTIMPTMAAATRGLTGEEAPSASTTLQITSQMGASIGMAFFSVLLSVNGDGGSTAPTHAEPFADTYFWAVALMLAAVVPALRLPLRRPAAVRPQDQGNEADQVDQGAQAQGAQAQDPNAAEPGTGARAGGEERVPAHHA
ncbi:DHA2 family efflux MFS transporter permease subunit [Streptomyces sp. LX-29]|uniref:DHA2 family efflux MFS transporter permease subunit n=1 Tax=Streptomyces sp. LX-29 TaxID=2900152 RepID=UPI00240DB094|nr:DHA2 family efflux MFS transporter permease subunit [Streptomyces sp. LX-29]WFB10718.1 DHA2 family efflux MFS transporter permease subunit [Streptomyces sp. LX-29]